jgi:hypothetical protein
VTEFVELGPLLISSNVRLLNSHQQDGQLHFLRLYEYLAIMTFQSIPDFPHKIKHPSGHLILERSNMASQPTMVPPVHLDRANIVEMGIHPNS